MIASRRGKNVALTGALGQLGFTAVMLIIWIWTGSLSAMSCMLLLVSGIPLWVMVTLMFYCRHLERREAVELEELIAQGATRGTIFETPDGEQLRPAAERIAFLDRWIVPVFTLLWAGGIVTVAVLLVRYLRWAPPAEIDNTAQGILLTLVIGFGAFLFSRYATGMSRGPQWRLLRATGSYLLVNVLFMLAVLGALIGARQDNMKIDLLVAYAIAIVQFVVAAELLLNFILDLYRPRIPGRERRPSFDPRLFNLLAEPGRVGHSIAEALNYQFGFEVSRTWFYQLLSRAFIPLLIFAAAVLIAMSSIVIVREGEQYVVLHWGRADPDRLLLEPGLHFKWPFPVDTAKRFETQKVHEILLGVGEHRETTIVKGKELYLWTEEHGTHEELNFLVAVPPRSMQVVAPGERLPPPPVNLIKLVVAVQYVIDNPCDFGYRYEDSAQLLECVAYREMSRYCASATLDSPVGGEHSDRPEAIMTYGRQRAAEELKRRIQTRADELALGVKVQYVGISAVHPPVEAAPAYQAVLEAERRMRLTRYEAEAEANRILVQVAGSPLAALKLALGINTLEELEMLRDNPTRVREILTEQINRTEVNIRTLDTEIYQEHLLGYARTGQLSTPKQELRRRYQEHLELLRKIQADTGGFDFNPHIARARQLTEDLFKKTVGRPAKIVAYAE
ncbi:MAG: SPFH domain-containing protein, partial [Planctomycetota bacterium]